jgi:hypothetical protein
MANQRETAQRERAKARDSRRNEPEESQADGPADEEQPLDGLKQAAKIAATSIALGAIAAGARALVEHRHASDEDDGPESSDREAEQAPELEDEAPEEAPQQEEQEQQGEAEEQDEPQQQHEAPQQREEEPPRPAQPRPQPRHEPVAGASVEEARSVADAAQEQLQLLVGKEPEMISALERNDDGWLVTLEVLEVSRIPESTDVLASYEVELDEDRNLRRYARVRRYNRSQSDQDGRS